MARNLTRFAVAAAVVAVGAGTVRQVRVYRRSKLARQSSRRGRFSLSHAQRLQMRLAFRGRREAIRPLRAQVREELQTLRSAVWAGASDKEVSACLERVAYFRERISELNRVFRKQAAAILTPEQRSLMLYRLRRRPHPGWRTRAERFGWPEH